ncbi:MAG: hypothetical protein RR590_04095 [Hungatella sp.]
MAMSEHIRILVVQRDNIPMAKEEWKSLDDYFRVGFPLFVCISSEAK